MSETIEHTYDPKVNLPEWAQNDSNIVAYAKMNYEFRCQVWDADTAQMRRFLEAQAERWVMGE